MFKRIIVTCRPIINTRSLMTGTCARPALFLRSLACAHLPRLYFSSGVKASAGTKSTTKDESKTSNGGLTSTKIPEEFPIVPLITVRKSPMFPGFVRIIDISNKKVIEIVKRKMSFNLPYVGVFMLKEDDFAGKQVTLNDIYSVGSFCNIVECHEHGSSLRIFVISHRRIKLLEPLPEDAASVIKGLKLKNGKRAMKNGVAESGKIPVDHENIVMLNTENLLHEDFEKTLETRAMMEEIVQTVREISQLNPIYREAVSQLLQGGFKMERSLQDPIYVSDIGAALVNAESTELQNVLEEINILSRLRLTLELLKKELALVQLQQKIRTEVEEKVKEQNRTYMLNEQLKAIKRELGILKDDKDSVSEKFRQRLEKLTVPAAVMEVIEQELSKLANLESFSAEFSVTRNYLDWLTLIPWGKYTEDSLDLVKAREILDHDHFGMKDAKDRILEFIAVSILKKSTHGKILCFHGPPGVGKTSIGRSIARALNREYYRFSVGGLTDVAEIKGHRRTYVGAMPGKLVQCLKKATSQNPVVLIDEIDKVGKGYQGDPASALLEVLDPQQNYSFTDHYMDVPLDLSKLLFICTANDISTIPPPLRDRMDLISLSGYTDDEKKHIAQNHLIPLISDTTGLASEQLTIGESALETLIRSYTRESGVRNLNQLIERIYRKAALKIILNDSTEKDLTSEGLVDLIGPIKYPENTFYGTKTPVGVTTGLAWTSVGGVVLYVECRTRADGGSGNLLLTGNMGDVMKESTEIALTVAQSLLNEKYPENDFLGLKKGRLHLHIPEGATPKDGPSAGCTLATAMLSAALNRPTKQPIAMTGELSLTGCVLPVGGIKEKVLAARRGGINEIILPLGNESDFQQLDESIKSHFQIHFVTEYSQIFDIVFGNFDR